MKNYEKTYLDTSCRRGRHCCRGRFYYPLLVDGRQQQRPGSAAAAHGFRRAGQGGAQIRARRCRRDRNGDADLQRGAEVAAGDHHRRGAFRGRRQGQRRRSAVHAGQPPDRRADRAGRGRARQGSGAARGRAARPAPLQRSRRQGRDHAGQCRQRQDPVRHPDRHHQGRSGRARQSEGPEKLHHDPRAVLGADQRRQCEGRQFRAAGRYRAACRHQPDGAGLCIVRGAAARAGRSARGHGARASPASPPPSRAISAPRPARSRWSKTPSIRPPAWSPCAAS